MNGLGDLGGFLCVEDEWWGEQKVVAVCAVDAALSGVGENAFFHGGLADAFGDVGGGGERFAGIFVGDEFDAEEEAEAADVADVGMVEEWGEIFAKLVGGWGDAFEEVVGLEVVEDGVACGGGDGVGLVGEAVLENTGTGFECVDYIL